MVILKYFAPVPYNDSGGASLRNLKDTSSSCQILESSKVDGGELQEESMS